MAMELRAYIDSHPKDERESVRVHIGKAAGVGPVAVRHWANGTRDVPGPSVNAVSEATEGRVLPHEIRPDIFPAPVVRKRKAAAPSAGKGA